MPTVESDLALAARHVYEGRILVARQNERIARLKALGCSTLDAEHSLQVLVSTLSIFEDYQRALMPKR